MANSYDAIFRSIKTSTIWVNAPHVKVVWINMLLSTDKNGIVEGSIPGLAKDAVVTVEQCREAIAIFLAPDPDSRTKDFEGRRIEEIDGGWRILNHRKYKEKREKAAQAHALAQARYRAKSDASRYHGDTSCDDPDLQISRSPNADQDLRDDKIQTREARESNQPARFVHPAKRLDQSFETTCPAKGAFELTERSKRLFLQIIKIEPQELDEFYACYRAKRLKTSQKAAMPEGWRHDFEDYCSNWLKNLRKNK
jgi:hypothetical protein